MSGNLATRSQQNGRDTSYRTNNLDTHLTHGCIPVFCHFSRVRLECAANLVMKAPVIPAFSESALRTLTGDAS